MLLLLNQTNSRINSSCSTSDTRRAINVSINCVMLLNLHDGMLYENAMTLYE